MTEDPTRQQSGHGAASALVGESGMVYRPLRELGEGGMARVYLAYGQGSQGVGKLVVLKVMRESQDDFAAREMFLEEARLSARLNHPNIVQVYEVVPTGDFPYMVMEYLDGKPLSKIRSGGLITQSMVLTVLSEALVGLHYAHELRDYNGTPLHIVHRDVSPHNVFVTYDGAVKVLDFGIAKTDTAMARTEAGQIKGKLAYMAPEQLLGEKLDRRADVFAVGAMLWEAAVGSRVWENVSQANLMHRLANGDIPKPSQRAAVDPELEAIILKAMAPDPERRYATALEMQQALESYRRRAFGSSSTRAVGAALAATFEQDREENRDLIARALHESVPPPSPEISAILLSSAPPAEGASRRARLPLLIAISVAAVAGAAFLVRARSTPRPPAVAPAAQPAAVQLAVRVTPPDAKIAVDGSERGVGTLVLNVQRDGRTHELSVTAPGFAPVARTVRFDGDQEISIALAPVAKTDNESPRLEPSAARVESGSRPSPGGARVKARAVTPQQEQPELTKPSPATPTQANCDPPYYFKGGIKTYKPECL
ncbi:MAG TPA: serine/threonine-protein kinase [Polyangiaceae bacterium]|nr:serine/threonine-protein kinase [Polyangiaceae bacterium]